MKFGESDCKKSKKFKKSKKSPKFEKSPIFHEIPNTLISVGFKDFLLIFCAK